MDAQQLVSEFLASEHGAQAAQALSAKGFSEADTQQLLGQATEAAHDQVVQQGAQPGGGILGDHAGKSFFASFAAGLAHGDGFLKSLVDGGEGIMTGRVAESLAVRAGIDPAMAATVAAAATPYIVAFLKQRFG